ncbi:MAG: prepilin-type N-terminal cleavage/methylation domain-containing protein [Ideonella sp.]|nr:prepilin-type N-terminal cleavage/methylation domain-containing protein [Ideonella sp.]
MLGQMKRNLINPMRRGFTLIEALVTVAILSVILTLTMPSAVDWIVIQRVKANAAEVATDLRFGRGESIKRNQRVVIAFKQVAGSQTCYVVHTRYSNHAVTVPRVQAMPATRARTRMCGMTGTRWLS